jgi:hypothetical protein
VRFLARFLYIILFHENEIISEDCRLERLDWVWILEPPRRLHEPSKREEFSNAWEEVICEFLEFLRGDRRLPSVIRGAAKAAKESSSRTNLEEIMVSNFILIHYSILCCVQKEFVSFIHK